MTRVGQAVVAVAELPRRAFAVRFRWRVLIVIPEGEAMDWMRTWRLEDGSDFFWCHFEVVITGSCIKNVVIERLDIVHDLPIRPSLGSSPGEVKSGSERSLASVTSR